MKNLFTLLLLLSYMVTFAQDKKALEARAAKMVEVTNNSLYEVVLDYTYPKVFDLVPREQLKQAMESMFKNDQFTITLVNVAPNFKFGEIRKIDNGYYSVIDYDMAMNMKFAEKIGEEKDMMVDMMKSSLKTDDITFDEVTNTIKIKKRSQLIGINDAASKNLWTFLNNENSALLDKMLGEKVIKELGLNK